jgi:hypothetical protein
VSEKKIKVTDKRMFTPDGELRDEFQSAEAEPERATAAASESAAEDPPAPIDESRVEAPVETPVETPPTGQPLEQPTIYDLVSVLAQPIALYLGDAALPDGESMENLDLARLHIDLLEVLKDKTEGNLTSEESTFLDSLLYQLRLRYVEKRG